MDFLKNTLSKPLQKMNYFQCLKGSSHQGQKLNYACINKNCLNNGLMCSICKTEHASHDDDVIPLKMLLDKLRYSREEECKDNQKSGKRDNLLEDMLESLEKTKIMIMYQLKTSVEKLSQIFMNLEDKLLKEFQQMKTKILQQIEVSMNFDIIIEDALNNKIKDRQQFQANIKSIAGMVKSVDNKKSFQVRNDPKILVDEYEASYSVVHTNLSQIIQQTQNILSRKSPSSPNKNKIDRKKVPGITKLKDDDTVFGGLFGDSQASSDLDGPLEIFDNKLKYTFSTLLKGNSILVQKGGLSAKQKTTGSTTRYVMVNEGSGLKNQRITFKVMKLVNWVGFGICIKSLITKSGYAFNYSKLGHGGYLLSTNGYTWSHSRAEDNISAKGFTVKEGEHIEVILSEHELKFKNKSNNKQLKIKIQIKPTQWPSVCFCANMCSAEDKIEIVNE